MGEHALPPQKSHRAYPSTSLKKTILPDIYFNKINTFNTNLLITDQMALKYTPVCLIQVKIVIPMFYHVDPIVPEVHDNSKLWKCENFT